MIGQTLLLATVSGTDWVALFLAVGIAINVSRDSTRMQRNVGTTPLGVPPWLWGVLGFLFGLITLIVYVIARRRLTRRLASGGAFSSAYGPRGGGGIGYGSQPPGYGPQPGGFGAPPTASGPSAWAPAPGTPGGAGDPGAAQGQQPLPVSGWYPDPSGRHQHRYWDGIRWTEHIMDAGNPGVDQP